jgi:hypothetical protein
MSINSESVVTTSFCLASSRSASRVVVVRTTASPHPTSIYIRRRSFFYFSIAKTPSPYTDTNFSPISGSNEQQLPGTQLPHPPFVRYTDAQICRAAVAVAAHPLRSRWTLACPAQGRGGVARVRASHLRAPAAGAAPLSLACPLLHVPFPAQARYPNPLDSSRSSPCARPLASAAARPRTQASGALLPHAAFPQLALRPARAAAHPASSSTTCLRGGRPLASRPD